MQNPIEVWNELANARRGELTFFGGIALSHGAPADISVTYGGRPKVPEEAQRAAAFLEQFAKAIRDAAHGQGAGSDTQSLRMPSS